MKRVLLCWLICAFVISSVSVCFANDTEDARQSRTERADIVEDVTGTDYIADNYLEERDVYIVNNADSSISIPKDGGDTIIFDSNGTKPIGFALPEEAEISRGQLLGNDTWSKEQKVSKGYKYRVKGVFKAYAGSKCEKSEKYSASEKY